MQLIFSHWVIYDLLDVVSLPPSLVIRLDWKEPVRYSGLMPLLGDIT